MTKIDIMVDVECLSLQPNAVILSIGAIRFDSKNISDWTSIDYPSCSFYAALPLELQIENFGGHISADVLQWWMRQSSDAQSVFEECATQNKYALTEQLQGFIDFVGTCQSMWASPAHFDYPKLIWLFEKCGLPFPFEYWQIHCGATLRAIADPKKDQIDVYIPPGFTAHNALEDAKKQALQVQQCLKLLRS